MKRLTNIPKPAIMSTVDGGHQQDMVKKEVVTMMNAKEAMNKVNTYIEDTACTIIAEIETDICAKAEKGTTYTDYAFKSDLLGKIQNRALTILANAGYHLRWLNNGALRISWEE